MVHRSVGTDSRLSGGRHIYSDATGSAATLTFTGTEVTWLGLKGRDFGKAAVYLDGVAQGIVDLYNNGYLFQQVMFSVSGLSNSAHTLRIEVTGQKNPLATWTNVGVDAFDVVQFIPDEGAYLTLSGGASAGIYESSSFDAGAGGGIFTALAGTANVPVGSILEF